MIDEAEDEVVEYDWAKIRELIDIVDLLRGHPNLKPIADSAMAELNAIANPPKEEEETAEEAVETEEKEPEDE